jgi:hypothetical protein
MDEAIWLVGIESRVVDVFEAVAGIESVGVQQNRAGE